MLSPMAHLDLQPETQRTDAVRRPRQQRSLARFETLLRTAESLLQDLEPSEVSIYTLAKAANMPPASVYHLFPEISSVFLALAEQILERFLKILDHPPSASFSTWQELMAIRFGEARSFYNACSPAQKLFFGSGYSAEIRSRDLEANRKLALRSLDEVQTYFQLPDLPELPERFGELIAISDALWSLSVHRHGYVTDACEEQARRAREAFARTFLPEYLTRR